MNNLTDSKMLELLAEVKAYLNITWEDEDTDAKLLGFITSSIARLDDIAGVQLDYLITPTSEVDLIYVSMCYLGNELLKARVFYENEKALDDFEKNYQSEVTSLFLQGRVYASKVQD